MDFDSVLNIASANQGSSVVQRRYSLETQPAKKDPKAKGVNPAAVQALLKKQHHDTKIKEMKQKKQKQELLAKRVELKSDRKARAMASRTKDNFHGYNGVPVIQSPKKRRSKFEMQEEKLRNEGQYQNIDMLENDAFDAEDDEDNFEYEQSNSEPEPEPEPEPLRSGKIVAAGDSRSRSFHKKHKEAPKPPPPPLNFADLLKLAEKKQFEPVELKAKVVKKDERPRTADEIRELELERKAKRWDKDRDPRPERERDSRCHSSSNSFKKGTSEKEQKHLKPQRSSAEKSNLPSFSGKKSHLTAKSDKGQSSSRASVSDRDKHKIPHSDGDRSKINMSNSSGATNCKIPSKAAFLQGSAKQEGPKPSFSHRSTTSSDLGLKKESTPHGRPAAVSERRHPGMSVSGQKSQQGLYHQSRSVQSSSLKQGPSVGGSRPRMDEPPRPGINSSVKSSCNASSRLPGDSSAKPGSNPQARPKGTVHTKPNGFSQARTDRTTQQCHSGSVGARPTGNESRRPGGGGGTVPRRPGGSGGPVAGRPGGGGGSAVGRLSGGGGPVAGRPGGGGGPAVGRPGGGGGPAVGRPGGGGGPAVGRPGGGGAPVAGRPGGGRGPAVGRPGGGGGPAVGRPGGGGGPVAGRPGGGGGPVAGRPGGGGGPVAGRPGGGGGPIAGRITGGIGSGPGRYKCTVVSETISSKNVDGPRQGPIPHPGMQHRPGIPLRPGMQQRPMNRPPAPALPPITSAYKRKYEDEEDEYDSEMDDFIDDEGDSQHEISKHIKEIFGYDRNRCEGELDLTSEDHEESVKDYTGVKIEKPSNHIETYYLSDHKDSKKIFIRLQSEEQVTIGLHAKYKDESDYALKFMESSWKDVQKEEARSLRLAVQEDQEEEKKEEEEMKRRQAKKPKRN